MPILFWISKIWIIDIEAIRDIEAGEEITLNYHGEPGDEKWVWF